MSRRPAVDRPWRVDADGGVESRSRVAEPAGGRTGGSLAWGSCSLARAWYICT